VPPTGIETPGPFEDERIDSFEIGFKSEPIPGAKFNGAAFFNTIDNLQREINVAGGSAVVQQVITNAADAEIYGIEFDALWPVTDNFIVNGTIGFLESSYTDVSVNLSTSFGKMTFNGNYAHRDQAFFTDNNLGFINAQDRFDASIGLDLSQGFNVTVYGKNLSNEVLHGNDTQLSNGTFAPLAKGRVFGVELNYDY